MTATATRRLALHAVTRVRERSAFAHETLDALLTETPLDERDSAFAMHLALGTIAWRGTLDAAVARFLKPDVRLQPLVADALALSAYEILKMRTPKRAAVNEGVELVREVQPRASGLANAVLRRIAEGADSFPWAEGMDVARTLSDETGHPEWMVRLLIDDLGIERAVSVLAADNEVAPLYVAIPREDDTLNSLSEAGADPIPGPITGSYVLRNAAAAVRSNALTTGTAIVADAAAQLAAACVPVLSESTIVELGAGRGSKTLMMAGRALRLGVTARFVAVDLHAFKLEALRSAANRMGLASIESVVADATCVESAGLAPLVGNTDSVLIDAPCSGLGTLRRHPDRRWRAKAEEVGALADLGARLLRSGASLVKPGGFVVYSTCTVARQENECVVSEFLAAEEGRGFRTSPISQAEAGELSRFITTEGWFQSLPEPEGPDGHFIARLVREA